MHILIATPAFPPFVGGGERHTGTLANQLADREHRVTVLTSAAQAEPDFWLGRGRALQVEHPRARLTIIRAPIAAMPGGFDGLLAWRKGMVLLSTLPGTTAALSAMARKLPALRLVDDALNAVDGPTDIVHGFNISWEHTMLAGMEFARRQRVPFVASPLAHLGDGRDRVSRNSTMRHQLQLLSSADLLLTNTAGEARGLLEKGVTQGHIQVAGPGVDVPESVPQASDELAGLQPYVVFVGRTSFEKGVQHAVKAVVRLRDEGCDIRLVIIGRETEEFQQFYGKLPASDRLGIHVLGVLHEGLKHAYIRGAEALLLPSRSDSFGIVLLEAWLYGRPVIAASAGGIPDVVADRIDGLLVPFGDVPSLAAAIRTILDDPALARELGANGARKVAEKFTWDVIARKVIEAYRSVLEHHEQVQALN